MKTGYKNIYQKYKNCITNVIFPLILFFYPLIKINQGVDVSDSTYSLGNYLFFKRLGGTWWVISTYLSNVIGWLLTKLPFGDTLLFMNLYTGLIVSALTIGLYFLLRKWMPAWIAFLGEFIAIGFLWIPTGILYNYLTYTFFALGAVFLYKGLAEEKNVMLITAGILLGLNVFVRVPNVAETALIVCVFYYSYICRETIQIAAKKTGLCIAGYLLGVAVPLIMILVQYGLQDVLKMIRGLSQIQNGDDSYSLWSMIRTTLDAYIRTGKWVVFFLAGILILFRFFWGRGMFSFRYYEDYSSMYEWGMIGLYLALVACAYLLWGKGVSESERLLGMLSFVILCITPLGSNNYTYQNLNNLFLTAPITVYAFVKLFRRRYAREKEVLHFPWKMMVMSLVAMILLQSIGFHAVFVFRDGMRGEKRDTKITGTLTADNMKTNAKNAEELTGLMQYCETEKLTGTEAIFYGDAPGLAFLLRMPSAISTSWADLDSYALSDFDTELQGLTSAPVIIMKKTEAATDTAALKEDILLDFIVSKHYNITYENEGFTVFRSGGIK